MKIPPTPDNPIRTVGLTYLTVSSKDIPSKLGSSLANSSIVENVDLIESKSFLPIVISPSLSKM